MTAAAPAALILLSRENTQVPCLRNAALLSRTVASFLDGTEEDDAPMIPLPNVPTAILLRIVEFLERRWAACGDSDEVPSAHAEWQQQFAHNPSQFHQETIDLLLAANFMDVPSLVTLCCQELASHIKGKTPEEIRAEFNIPNDFTPEEEEEIRKENAWCDEPAHAATS